MRDGGVSDVGAEGGKRVTDSRPGGVSGRVSAVGWAGVDTPPGSAPADTRAALACAPSVTGAVARELWLATANPHKCAELRRLVLEALGARAAAVRVRDLGDLPDHRPPPEEGESYEDNARRKAEALALRLPAAAVLADDSGIEVEALGGQPGPRSNRWVVGPTGEPLDAAGRNAALLDRLRGVPEAQRGARMVSCVVLLLPDGHGRRAVVGRGEVRGRIAREARGSGGFGYDPVFLLPDGRRLSEVEPHVKDLLGHRGQAVRAVVAQLGAWLEGRPA